MLTADQIFENMARCRHKLDMDDEINSEEGLHCPHCGNFHDANDLASGDYPEVWQEDEGVAFECHECGKDFMFRIVVNYEWYVTKPEPSETDQGLIPIPAGYNEA